jgi:lipopolysaccharide export LptBFGC system permease protein LptF
MSSNSSLPLNNLDNITKYPEINDVIVKEREFLLLSSQYNTINKDYLDELKKSNPSTQILKNLLENLNNVNAQLMHYAREINEIKNNRVSKFNEAIDNKNTLVTNNINSIMEQLEKEEIELSKMKQRVSDAEGINKEYTSEIKSTNYKYLLLLLLIVFLILSIILSLTLPYKTNLESNLFVILCIVVVYYLYVYVRQYKYDFQHKVSRQYGNVKHFLRIS